MPGSVLHLALSDLMSVHPTHGGSPKWLPSVRYSPLGWGLDVNALSSTEAQESALQEQISCLQADGTKS
jgi:hypothetical protein